MAQKEIVMAKRQPLAGARASKDSLQPDARAAKVSDAIVNKTRKTTVFENPRWATSVAQQMKGLMFIRPGPQDCIIFLFLPAQRVHFHMWFVFGPIDILALDGTGTVIALKERFRPWTFWNPGVSASAVVELPAGTIARTRTQFGDVVALPQRPMASGR